MRKQLWRSVLLALAGVGLLAGNAMALTFTPTLDDIASWMQLSTTSPAATTVTDDRPYGLTIDFVTKFATVASPVYAEATIGTTGTFDLTGSDTFLLKFLNHNENPWDYTLWMSDGVDTASTAFTLNPSSSNWYTASLDISSLNLGAITSYGFTVGATIPNGPNAYPDWAAETKITHTPEPATMVLFGTGLLGLAGVARRRKNRQ